MKQLTTIQRAGLMAGLLYLAGLSIGNAAEAEDSAADLAKKLANPVSDLISIPFQYAYDDGQGASGNGSRNQLNIQPVIPITLNEEWNLITRTIVPLIDQSDIPLDGDSASGLGNITASQFFSPKNPTSNGWIWGVGPVEMLPTASEDALGSDKWGLGITGVALKQSGPWTMGALANQIWSVGGDSDEPDINAMFLQPFLTYITKTKTTLVLNTESTYDWENDQWSIPVNVDAFQLFKVGKQIMQFGGGVRYWVESPDGGPDGWGFRVQLTLLFPK